MAYCVNGTWTASGKIGAGTDVPTLGLTAAGSAVGDAALRLDNTSAGGRAWELYSTGTSFSQGNCNLIFYRSGVDGAHATMTLDWGGRIGIGTWAPTEMLHICQCAGSGPEIRLQNSASSHYIRAYDNNFNILMNAAVVALSIKNNGNIGIGTTTPGAILDVRGDYTDNVMTIRNSNGSYYSAIGYYNCQGTLKAAIGIGNNSGGAPFANNAYVYTPASTDFVFYISGGERMRLSNTGNIGIGNNSPCGQLSLQGNISDCKLLIYDNGSANDRYGFGIRNSQLLIYSACAGDACGGITFGKHDGTTFTENVRFMNSGNVGIGVKCAASLLHLAGGGTGTRGALRLSEVGLTNYWELGRDNTISGDFTINSNASEMMRIMTSGNIGIGTSSPTQLVEAYKSSNADAVYQITNPNTGESATAQFFASNGTNRTQFYHTGTSYGTLGAIVACQGGMYNQTTAGLAMIANNVSGIIKFATGGTTEKVRIDASGNFGINTTSPSYKLHVNGTFYAAGSSVDYKEGICNYDTDSCLFMCLKPVTYQYKDEFKHLGKELKSETQIGLIAEDVAEVYPELAVLVNEEDNKVVRNVDYEKLSIILLSEVQKLRKELDELKIK